MEAADEAAGQIPYPTNLPNPLPFFVYRSNMGNLPVYHDTRAGGSKQVTIVRKFSGDMKGLGRAVEELCRAPVHLFHGRIEVKGHHAKRIKGWLEHLGF